MKIAVFLFALVLLASTAQAQVTPVLYAGVGMSSLLTTGAKSVPVIGGAKLNIALGKGCFAQPLVSISHVEPSDGSDGWWSVQAGGLAGRKIGTTRFSPVAGLIASRNRVGLYLPTVIAGGIVKLDGHVSALALVSRNESSWGMSLTFGYAFKSWK